MLRLLLVKFRPRDAKGLKNSFFRPVKPNHLRLLVKGGVETSATENPLADRREAAAGGQRHDDLPLLN
jgi:hypothetical protein